MHFSSRLRAALLALPLCLCISLPVRSQVAPFTALHAFHTTDGGYPDTHLVPGGPGIFFGTTSQGGANKTGVVYKLATDGTTGGSVLTVLHEFGPPFYGGASADGFSPSSLTLTADGSLYGTTYYGGANGRGVLFRIAPNGTYSVLHDFGSSASDGSNPSGIMQAQDGSLYIVSYGGSFGGVLFRATLSGTVTLLHNFGGSEGYALQGAPVQAPDGTFYGVAGSGGTHGRGTVYKFTTDGTMAGTSLSVVYAFRGHLYQSSVSDADGPLGRPIIGADGALYGTASGGRYYQGSIYRVTTTGVETVLHSFFVSSSYTAPEGVYPYGSLAQGTDGSLYGTATYGGANKIGTAFRLDAAGRLSLLHTFTTPRYVPGDSGGAGGEISSDGGYPAAGLTLGSDGDLYGTTSVFGHRKRGTIFKIPISQLLETELSPSFAYAGGTSKSITVTGTNFVQGSVVRVGGTALPTTFVSSGILTATVPVSLLAVPAVLDVSVVNPGGVVTNALPFTVKTALAGFTLDRHVVTAGVPLTGTVTLSAPAPVNGQKVRITSYNAPVSLTYPNDGTVTVPAGQTTVTFTLHTYGGSSITTFGSVTATAGMSFSQTLTINPGLGYFAIQPGNVTGGSAPTATVSLYGPAASDVKIFTRSSDTMLTSVPTSVTIPKGQTSVTFPVHTHPVALLTTVTITATVGETTLSKILTLNP